MLLSARNPGIASVHDAVLGFSGHEFYVETWPELEGRTFGRWGGGGGGLEGGSQGRK